MALIPLLYSSPGAHIASPAPALDTGLAVSSNDAADGTSPYSAEAVEKPIDFYETIPEMPDDRDLALPVAPSTEPDVRQDTGSVRVPPIPTSWGEPWNRRSLVLKMDHILTSHGVAQTQVRVRMIAHAIVASGWRQNIWNYNAWGVQVGSWKGPWFIMSTLEMDENGHYYTVYSAMWRAFSGWDEAIADYRERISPTSSREYYREAYKWLVDPDAWADISYWNALKEGRYYTDRRFPGRRFYRLCNFVRQVLKEA
ncbi:MAG: hypothetical protein QNJ97_26090 [Myxococcota bacterium]|nr:hypothetical protein [Myxococcota bacterium]